MLQSTILRLVENDCAVMKRFMGKSEEEFLAYLAVISQSVVKDWRRRQVTLKRSRHHNVTQPYAEDITLSHETDGHQLERKSPERDLLAKEVWSLSLRSLKNHSGRFYIRDRKVFDLYYSEGLSMQDIAANEKIGLSVSAVQKVLNRLTDRVRAEVASVRRRGMRSEKPAPSLQISEKTLPDRGRSIQLSHTVGE